ncbi:MAG TPA: VWA domain-containing protein [Bryobacteraceae bacterium]|nr:VWA domain-containing protein [Bryobacteraceae bacterium]
MGAGCVRFTPVLCLSLLSGFAQQPETFNRRINLNVAVADRSGNPVTGLEQSDFALLDNKHPQKILSFQAVQGIRTSSPPVEGVVVVDEVNTRFTNVSYARIQVDKFLRANDGKLPYPMSIAVFTDAGIAAGNAASRDGNTLAAALDSKQAGLRYVNRDQGVYGAGDRLGMSLMALSQLANREAARPGRKLIFWVSPGWPILTGPNIQLDGKDRQNVFRNVVDMSRLLLNGDITLFSIDPLGGNDAGQARTYYYEDFVKGVKRQDQVQMGNLALQVLAIQSGGQVFDSDNDVAGEIAKAVADASAYYVLTFDTEPGDGPNEYHEIQVKLDRKGLKVHTRTGYYAQP